jgi:hypothetical protein
MVKVLNNIEEARQYNEELCKAHEITAELYHKAMDKGMKIYTSVGMNSPEYTEHKKNEKTIIERMASLEDTHRDVCWEWDLELLF